MENKKPAPLMYKPDLDEANKRWEAFYAGEMIDRPVISITAPKTGFEKDYVSPPGSTYYERAHGDFDELIDRAESAIKKTFYGGEAMPVFWLDFSPDEIALYLGAELEFSKDSGDTSWSKPIVEDWAKALPLRIDDNNPYWQRKLAFYKRAADRLRGKTLLAPLDLHTNLDLISAIRAPQRLCIDLIEQPEMIDRAMDDARAIFRKMWTSMSLAGCMDDIGYCQLFYSMEGAAILQCDFAYMISPKMFNRWVLPALVEEAGLVKHALYHWDGPGALVHFDALVKTPSLHALSYVPGDGVGASIKRLDVLKRVQAAGKAVHAFGSPQELKLMHRELRPQKVVYTTSAASQAEAEELLEWFVKNT
jgi:hypothetical protein